MDMHEKKLSFGEVVSLMMEKLKLENTVLKIENKVLREFIIENNLRVPNEKIVESLPSPGQDKETW